MNQVIWNMILILCFGTANAQDIRFSAQTDAEKVLVGSYVELSYTLENAEGGSFIPPDFGSLQILSGPNRSTQMSIINGVVSRKMTLSYRLLCQTAGKYVIPPASINANGKKYHSNSLQIEVIKGDPSSVQTQMEDDMFVLMELSDSTAFVGQQITLKYVLYSTKDVHSYDFISESKYDGFFVTRIRNFRDRPQRVIVNGREYIKRALKTVALFPQQSGQFAVDAANVNLGIPEKGGQPSFFFTTRVRNVRKVTSSAEIEIVAAPVSVPTSYSGAIGKFSMKARVDRKTISTDDAVTIYMTITGNGDSNFIGPPEQKLSSNFDVYDPNIISERTVEQGDQIITEKQFEYLVVPIKPGNYNIRPEFSYFDTDSNDFVQLNSGPFSLRVVQGGNLSNSTLLREDVAETMAPLMTSTQLVGIDQQFLFSRTYWILLFIALLAPLGIVLYRVYLNKKLAIDPVLAKKQAAKKLAMSRLQQAHSAMELSREKAFYESINHGLFGYVADKLVIPHADLTMAKVESFLNEKGIAPELNQQFLDLLHRSQMALYAANTANGMNVIYDQAIDILSNLESQLN